VWLEVLIREADPYEKVTLYGGKMTQFLKTKESKNEPAKGGQGNGKNNKIDRDRIRRLKKSFLPSWMRETGNPKPKLSSD